MLTTLRIDPDAPQDWAWDGTRYATPGGGVIEPYAHPLTEHAAVTDGTRTAIILRERVRCRPGLHPAPVKVTPCELDQITLMARQWPADYLLVETECHRPVQVTAGSSRTTPLYLAHSDGVLHGSWDIGRLRPFTAGLNPKEATRMLACPRELAAGTDVLAAFAEAIDAALGMRPLDPGTTTFHLTGGLDSGSIGSQATRHGPGC